MRVDFFETHTTPAADVFGRGPPHHPPPPLPASQFPLSHPACVDGEDSRTDGRTDGMPTASFVYLFPPQPQPPTSFFGEFVCVCASVSSGVLLFLSLGAPFHPRTQNARMSSRRVSDGEREKRELGLRTRTGGET